MSSQIIKAPSIPIQITARGAANDISLSEVVLGSETWQTAVAVDLNAHPILEWHVYDVEGVMVHRSSDYVVSSDGSTVTFEHTFPPLHNGDTFTLTQNVTVQ